MKVGAFLLCFLALCIPVTAGPRQIPGFKGRGIEFLKPHPVLVMHFLKTHKMLLLSSGVLFAANAAYARNYIQMQQRCPQCLFYGQTRPASFASFDGKVLAGLAGTTVIDYYILRLHRTDAKVGVWAIVGSAAAWQAVFAYDYSKVNNLADFNRMGVNRVHKTGGLDLYAPTALPLGWLPRDRSDPSRTKHSGRLQGEER